MTGQIVVYDLVGASPFCVESTQKQLQKLCDDGRYKVELFSERADPFRQEDPLPLFVIPGGHYREMQDELSNQASNIQRVIRSGQTGFLGICAGAIAASNQIMYENPYSKTIEVFRGLKSHLNLYPQRVCLAAEEFLKVNGSALPVVKRMEGGSSFYPLFFEDGVFFERAHLPSCARPLLSFKDETKLAAVVYAPSERKPSVYSGCHPEFDADTVASFPYPRLYPRVLETKKQQRAQMVQELSNFKEEQDKTMNMFLEALQIGTKTS